MCSSICLFSHPCVHPSFHLSVHLSIIMRLSVHPSIYSICLSVPLYIHLSENLSILLFLPHLLVYLFTQTCLSSKGCLPRGVSCPRGQKVDFQPFTFLNVLLNRVLFIGFFFKRVFVGDHSSECLPWRCRPVLLRRHRLGRQQRLSLGDGQDRVFAQRLWTISKNWYGSHTLLDTSSQ